jgi:hypothetical protein
MEKTDKHALYKVFILVIDVLHSLKPCARWKVDALADLPNPSLVPSIVILDQICSPKGCWQML